MLKWWYRRPGWLKTCCMHKYLDFHYDGPGLELFGTGHITALAIIGGICAFLIWGWKDPGEAAKRNTRYLLIGLILLSKSSWHAWNAYFDNWSIQEHLPLHLCAVTGWLSAYILLTKSYRVYEIVYFVGIAGAVQALLTPEANMYALPHFRAIQTFAGHGLIVIALVYMTSIEGYRPTLASILKTMLAGNLYMLAVTGINLLVDSNYMYTMRKPAAASALDFMGPWPWYLIVAELFALALFLLLYVPIALTNRRPAVSVDVSAR